jgi:hypothetical protein
MHILQSRPAKRQAEKERDGRFAGVRNLDIIVTTLSIGSDQEALALLQRLRAKPSSTPSQIALRSGNGLDDRQVSSEGGRCQ